MASVTPPLVTTPASTMRAGCGSHVGASDFRVASGAAVSPGRHPLANHAVTHYLPRSGREHHMQNYKIEVVQRTFFWVTAADQDAAEEIALEWATNWDQPDDAVVDGKGGLEIGDVEIVG
jgi:hypothetical protein